MKPEFDLFIIGGGINGAGIARDAAGRGLSVCLAEKGDLAGATSSASSKLIHGGLRYLEYYEFRLVREALKEREVLLGIAPHNIKPLQFILPHDKSLRPVWMIRAGLFLYDHLAGRHRLEKSRAVDLSRAPQGAPLKDSFRRGFSYADCWTDDARLVVLNALDAAERGAQIHTRTACTALHPENGSWRIQLTDEKTGQTRDITAAKIVNAAGPWVHDILSESGLVTPATPTTRLVKGSHIVVPRLYDGDHAYILQQPDRRIVFALPFEHDFTLIGTTDVEYHDDPDRPAIDEDEKNYLCAAINRFFRAQISLGDILHSYSGVRPLFNDGEDNAAAVTRDYRLIQDSHDGAAILSAFGGKITTYRELAAHAVNALYGGKEWTHRECLPGGDLPGGDLNAFIAAQTARYPDMPPALIARWCRQYGTRMERLIGTAHTPEDLGADLTDGHGLHEAEIRYLVRTEWARTAEDILWRRTRLGLRVTPDSATRIRDGLSRILPSLEKEETQP